MATSTHAFPTSTNSTVPGMTLRDYFAAQVLPHVMTLTANGTFNTPSGNATQADMAAAAYAIADAMIAERGQQSQTPQRSDADF